jgi:hypothetical protein
MEMENKAQSNKTLRSISVNIMELDAYLKVLLDWFKGVLEDHW